VVAIKEWFSCSSYTNHFKVSFTVSKEQLSGVKAVAARGWLRVEKLALTLGSAVAVSQGPACS